MGTPAKYNAFLVFSQRELRLCIKYGTFRNGPYEPHSPQAAQSVEGLRLAVRLDYGPPAHPAVHSQA